MKKLLSFIALTLMGHSMMAKPVEPEKAMQVVKNFVAQYVKGTDKLEATVVYTHKMPKSGQPAMYVVNLGNMFVIVSADDIAHPVLGYSLSRPWPTSEAQTSSSAKEQGKVVLPSQVTSYLNDLAAQIEAATLGPQTSPSASNEETATEWQQLLSLNSNLLTTTNLPDSVGPLLTTTWDQGQYYNALCPEDAAGPAGHCVTGCVATAMAQIINYWGYPIHGRGIHSYQSNYGTLTVNYDSATYDYAHMPTALTSASTPQEVNAVATLMRDCGVAAVMDYGATESSSYDVAARVGLINYFHFNPNLSYVGKPYFSRDEWIEMLRTDISAGRPIYYGGQGSGGHAFICDGYKQNGYFHFNFGWSGYADGWYLTDAVNPAGMDFNSNQTALIGITPDSTSNIILGHMVGTSTFTIDEPIDYYHLLGNNDYWGDAYSNDCHSYVYLLLSDTTKQIGIDIVHFQDQHVNLIDSIGSSYRDIWFIGDHFTPFQCSSYMLKMEYIGNFYPDGFHLHIGESTGCKMVNNIGYLRDTTSIQLTWHENASATQWEIEYGFQGFTLGQGVSILTNDTNVTIGNLQRDGKYDFYIRSICSDCSDSLFSEWNKVSIQLSPYWTDVVTNIPDGYVEDANGNITISSAEGLAWLAVQVNGLHGQPAQTYVGKTVTLTQDIDLSGYRWNPIGRYWHKSNDWGYTAFLGTFDGGNHTISNLYVRDTNSMLGLFGTITSGGYGDIDVTLKNVKIEDGIVECISHNGKDPYFLGGWGCLGGLVGYADGKITIDNCHSSINIKGRSQLGTLCGSITNMQENYGYIRNCSANGKIIGYWAMGEIVGDLYGNILLENCYSYGEIMEDTIDVDDLWGRGSIGGLVGTLADATVANCYSASKIDYQTNSYIGLGIGEMYAAHPLVKKVYGKSQGGLSVVGNNSDRIHDTAIFNTNDWNLSSVIAIGDSSYNILLDALNAYVSQENNPELFMWKKEQTDSLVVFTTRFVPSCYNPTNIHISNATQVGDTIISTKIEWIQAGAPEGWDVLYVSSQQSIDSGTIISVSENPCVLNTIPVGRPLDFYVRARCDSNDYSAWVGPITYLPDRLRWTEVVTSQPEGYQEDSEGNVYISSAEGLTWLSCVVNELNGANHSSLDNKQIFLLADINLSAYRWTSIGSKDWWHQLYCSSFYGNNHTISGLYCNELSDYQGLFGLMSGDVYNLVLTQCNVMGEQYVGAIAGYSFGNKIVNCSVNGDVYGIDEVGGLVGRHLCYDNTINNIENSCFIGSVASRRDIVKVNTSNSYIGGICGSPFRDTIINCYVVSEIADSVAWSGIITGIGGTPYYVANCYYKDYETNLSITNSGCSTANNSSFTESGNTWTLASPSNINGIIYSDLVDALNAWVDANNTDGQYRHWAADSANVNGGYPVFAAIPCTPATGSDSITVCDSYTWHGNVYTADATLIDTLSTLDGCDSIVTHYLTVKHSNSDTETTTACESYFFGGQWLYASGQYSDTLTNIAGCDSIATLYLTINNPIHTATTVTACDSYTWQEAVITTSGTYHYTHTDAHGCTQDDTLYLTINHNDTVIVDEEVCDSLTWYGTTYTASAYGVQYLSVPNTVGCDSIFFLDLTVNYTTYGEMSAVSCDSYQWDWNGAVYTASGDYTYRDTVNMNSQFCDSVLTLHLTVNYSATSDTTATACDLFVWYGNMGYDVSGDYEHRWWNVTADGCDSILTLHLTINRSAETTVTDTAEASYSWHGETYTESGTYTWTGTTAEGCDSTVTLVLTVTQVGIEDVEVGSSFNIFVSDGRIVVEGATGEEVSIFDMIGRQILREDINSSLFTLHSSLSAGVYLVKVGSLPARKVVVIR